MIWLNVKLINDCDIDAIMITKETIDLKVILVILTRYMLIINIIMVK